MYIVESDFEYKGYRCVVIFGNTLYRCGYVGLPEGHPLYGKHGWDHLDIKKEDLGDIPIGKRGILSLMSSAMDEDERIKVHTYFNVHGSITYGDGGKYSEYPVESDLWWFGFDCGHAGDGNDLASAKKYWPDNENVKRRIRFDEEHYIPGEIRTKEYCEEECRSLVDQIIELEGKDE